MCSHHKTLLPIMPWQIAQYAQRMPPFQAHVKCCSRQGVLQRWQTAAWQRCNKDGTAQACLLQGCGAGTWHRGCALL